MELKQNDREYLADMVHRGELTIDQANVRKVQMQRVLLVIGRVPASVRKALNDAVKRGELGHLAKDGHKPETYFHPTFQHIAIAERAEHERGIRRAAMGVVASASEVYLSEEVEE